MAQKYNAKLAELNKLIKDEISIVENGGKLASFKRDIKPREKELRRELTDLLRQVAKTGNVPGDWPDVRNYIIVMIRELLDNYNQEFRDSKTFEQEKEVILQYFVFFEKPPFTIQRIAELMLDPKTYYKSTKKILYAFEKLVNVNDPDER